jgi:hypothetical protein
MSLIVVEDGTCNHTGSICGGSVSGTLSVGSNDFFKINGKLVMVEDGELLVPEHNNPPCIPPNLNAHAFIANNLFNNYFYINNKLIILVGDEYSTDATEVDNAGSNDFFEVI